MKKKTKRDDGFTFFETLICLAIILILTAVVGVSTVKYLDQARTAAAKSDIENFKKALETYYTECGMYPSKAQGLNALWEKPVLYPVPSLWNGPYLDTEIPLDPWGNEYVYNVPGKNNLPFEIISYGADGMEGGEGTAADIISWKRR